MKKKYDDHADYRTIHYLDLYTKLIGMFWGSLGVNFFLVFLYWKFVLQYGDSFMVLGLSIIMFMLTPSKMTDTRKKERDLTAVIIDGVVHGILTIGSVWLLHFWLLLVVYVIEILIAILLVVKFFKGRSDKIRKRSK